MWEIEYTDELGAWLAELAEDVFEDVAAVVEVLEERGPRLGRPYVDTVKGSRHVHMKELRVQSHGLPYRIFFAFDPRQTAILLLGGCKASDKRFYQRMITRADELYESYLEELRREGLLP